MYLALGLLGAAIFGYAISGEEKQIQNSRNYRVIKTVTSKHDMFSHGTISYIDEFTDDDLATEERFNAKVLFFDSGAVANEITSEVAEKLGLIEYGDKKVKNKAGKLLAKDAVPAEKISLSNNFTYDTYKIDLQFRLSSEDAKDLEIITDDSDPSVEETLCFHFPAIWIPTSDWDALIGNEGALKMKMELKYASDEQSQNCHQCQNCRSCQFHPDFGKTMEQNCRICQNCRLCSGEE